MRPIIAALAFVLALTCFTIPAHAAPAGQACAADAFQQADMVGTYVSDAAKIRVIVYPCGGISVMWSNEYGTHEAGYAGVERLPAGGILARVLYPDPIVRSLDGRNVIALKPAEVGWVQVITTGPFADNIRVYRLRKIA